MNKTVDIIMPTYDQDQGMLEACIRSMLVTGEINPIRILLINNGLNRITINHKAVEVVEHGEERRARGLAYQCVDGGVGSDGQETFEYASPDEPAAPGDEVARHGRDPIRWAGRRPAGCPRPAGRGSVWYSE